MFRVHCYEILQWEYNATNSKERMEKKVITDWGNKNSMTTEDVWKCLKKKLIKKCQLKQKKNYGNGNFKNKTMQ